MAEGRFKVVRKIPAQVFCRIFPSLTFGLLKWSSEAPGCIVTIERMSESPKFGRNDKNFDVYLDPLMCGVLVGEEKEFYLIRKCGIEGPTVDECSSLLPTPHSDYADKITYACQRPKTYWTIPEAKRTFDVLHHYVK